MHTSDALSRLHYFNNTPDQKDVIPLNFLQHLIPNYIEHSYSYLVENLYIHKTKTLDAMTVRKENVVDHPNQSHKFQLLKYKNTFISKMTMSINGKTTCILLPAIEAVCT